MFLHFTVVDIIFTTLYTVGWFYLSNQCIITYTTSVCSKTFLCEPHICKKKKERKEKSEKRAMMHFSANPRGFLRSLLRQDYGGGVAGVSSCS